ncbi:phosphodiester glycosidase family protein [Scytonema hofmannii FACHB-248]|uniref:Phosphodiester glycosidase family protein n=1 Tax=Scytonema hofmannii FACHB-248 TaxID=1842502 RepID=A0ABR8GQE7_9CYAN|nr:MULTISPECIES: phosphodiester glycosidase family protein [Nostocales]MBD2605452.1 phosphodiester glycosidase family protein [Scytonema hofmannii FACHB-248]
MNKLFGGGNFLPKSRKLLSLSLVTTVIVITLQIYTAQALEISKGFKLILSETGLQVYKKDYSNGNSDYVTVVNLEKGTIRNLTGTTEGTPNAMVKRKLPSEFWQDAVKGNTSTRKVIVVVNASFFSTNEDPTGIAFGLKLGGNAISYGYAIAKEYPGQIRTFSFNPDQGIANIQSYAKETFNSTPEVVGALDVVANKSPLSYLPRTFVGVRDNDGNGTKETVIFYSSSYARQIDASNVLTGFGASVTAMLDGGGSTFLIVNGNSLISTKRKVPHAIAVYAGN